MDKEGMTVGGGEEGERVQDVTFLDGSSEGEVELAGERRRKGSRSENAGESPVNLTRLSSCERLAAQSGVNKGAA